MGVPLIGSVYANSVKEETREYTEEKAMNWYNTRNNIDVTHSNRGVSGKAIPVDSYNFRGLGHAVNFFFENYGSNLKKEYTVPIRYHIDD
ncbi:MAG: hypothetical protein K6G84_00120 [Lachnospiraceae bacterium]|nr:hypothetical protein [Lachnospiraceae bacterium]